MEWEIPELSHHVVVGLPDCTCRAPCILVFARILHNKVGLQDRDIVEAIRSLPQQCKEFRYSRMQLEVQVELGS